MKMNLGKRLVLFAHWVLSILVCLLAFLELDILKLPTGLQEGFSAALVSCLVLDAFLIVAVALWVFRRPEKKEESGFITLDSTEDGRTRISVNAVDSMIRQAVRDVEGIMEMKTGINDCGEAITVDVNLSLLKGTHVPSVSATVKRAIRSYIEQNCGLVVREVRVDVQFVETDPEPAKRGWRKKAKPAVEAAAPAEEAPEAEEAPVEAPEAPIEEAEVEAEPAVDGEDEIVLTLDPVEETEEETQSE